MTGPYVRPEPLSRFDDGSPTDGTVLVGRILDSLELVEGSVVGAVPGATQALANLGAESAAHASATYQAPNVVCVGTGIDPTGVSDSTAALQAKINACPSGGSVYLPAGTYKITSPLVIPASMTLTGASLVPTFTPRSSGGSLNAPTSPRLAGAVLNVTAAGVDAIQVTASALSVHFANLGILFASGLASTGHGIYSATATTYNGGIDTGLSDFTISNVQVYGHDGNHYAFYLLNPILGRLSRLRGYGGGGLYIEGHGSAAAIYGNLVTDDTYFDVFNAGSAHGYALVANGAQSTLNLITMIRPQTNITGAANTQGTQACFTVTTGAFLPTYVDVIDPDMEAWGSTCPIDFGGVSSTVTVRNGGILYANPTGGYNPGGPANGYQAFTASGTFTVPQTVTKIRVRCIGGGGGGGGGGSALTSGGVTAQAGGGGGGAAMCSEAELTVTPGQSIAVTVGQGGNGGNGGALNGNAGTDGAPGTVSTFGTLVYAQPGGRGQAGGANVTTPAGGGLYGYNYYQTTLTYVPGMGGSGQSNNNGNQAFPMPPGLAGGGGGGAASATNGGGGGVGSTVAFPVQGIQAGGTKYASATAAGVNGGTATTYGCGGGGGGGGAPGGAGGNGGNGAPGLIEIWW